MDQKETIVTHEPHPQATELGNIGQVIAYDSGVTVRQY